MVLIGLRFTPTRVGTMARRVLFLLRGGSPPRAWGRFFSGVGQAHSSRFTPTRVGTITLGTRHCGRAVHPHARGDDDATCSVRCQSGSPPRAWGQSRRNPARLRGSPPRAWGRQSTSHRRDRIPGSPPRAWGRSSRHVDKSDVPAVHPHARGDDHPPERTRRRTGSPPRAWGRSAAADATRRRGRFTPTRVGTIRHEPC